MTYRKKLTPFALAVAIGLAAVACGWGDGGNGTRPNEVAPAESDPFISIQAELDELSARNLFEVEADHAEYWRMFTLDRFDGESWSSSNPDGSEGGVPLSAPATLPPSGGGPPPGAETLSQTFMIFGDLGSPHALPMAQTAEEIAGPIGDITWDPARSEVFIDGDLEAGMTYTVRSRIVVPTPEELDRVDHLAPRAYGQWTELPADLDPRIGKIAERWTADAASDYRKVLAIQQHFHNGSFVYSLDVEPVDDADALVEFLTQTRAGFCQQYSSAMAVMVRTLGLPARIGVGFRPGTQQEDASYLVQDHGRPRLGRSAVPRLRVAPVRAGARHSTSSKRAGRHIPEPGRPDGFIVTSTCAAVRRPPEHGVCCRTVAAAPDPADDALTRCSTSTASEGYRRSTRPSGSASPPEA